MRMTRSRTVDEKTQLQIGLLAAMGASNLLKILEATEPHQIKLALGQAFANMRRIRALVERPSIVVAREVPGNGNQRPAKG